jgi:hypothetical protein
MRATPSIPLDFVDCPDRRIANAAANLVSAEAVLPGVGVTAVLPRRSYAPIVSRLLHDRTADKMASLISRIPHAAATIVPFDVRSRVESLARRGAATPGTEAGPTPPTQPGGQATAGPTPAGTAGADTGPADTGPADTVPAQADQPSASQPLSDAVTTPADTPYERPPLRRGVTPIGSLTRPGRATVEGRVHTVEIRPVEHNTVLACDVEDATGQLTAMFYGRSNIAGLRPGVKVRLRGQVGIRTGRPVMINPAYELLAPGEATSAEQRDQQDSQPRRGRKRGDDQQE